MIKMKCWLKGLEVYDERLDRNIITLVSEGDFLGLFTSKKHDGTPTEDGFVDGAYEEETGDMQNLYTVLPIIHETSDQKDNNNIAASLVMAMKELKERGLTYDQILTLCQEVTKELLPQTQKHLK